MHVKIYTPSKLRNKVTGSLGLWELSQTAVDDFTQLSKSWHRGSSTVIAGSPPRTLIGGEQNIFFHVMITVTPLQKSLWTRVNDAENEMVGEGKERKNRKSEWKGF